MEERFNNVILQTKQLFREIVYNLHVDQRELYLSVIAILSIFVIIPGITYAAFSDDLLTKEAIMNKNNTGLLLLDRNGNEFFRFYQAKNQDHIPLDQIPKHVQDAVIASEDKDFYQHSGFSPKAIVRSAIKNFEAKDFAQGGSTITQQLVKNSLLTPDKNLFRKYQEVLLAQQIEGLYSKEEILEMYLNSVYFGEGAFGIQQASQAYFGKNVQDLNIAEAAMIVGVLPAPSTLSPISGKFDEAKKRQLIVLQKMLEQGSISSEQKEEALNQKLSFQPVRNENNLAATHFALLVKDQLEKEYGEEAVARSGFVVKTTLDLSIQQQAIKEIDKQVAALSKSNANNGAAVVMNPKTGEVLAMVGSKDWNDPEVGKINMAVAPRSPGSSFKPIIYAAGFEKGIISPGTVMQDKKTTFRLSSNPFDKPYEPKNYDGRFRGNVTVRRALSNSLNIPAVEIMQKVGLDSGMEMAKRLGITTLKEKSNYGLSFVLGSAESRLLDMTAVYAVFANDGMKVDPFFISEIKEKNGKVLFTHKVEREPVLRPEVAFLISSILSDNRARQEVFGSALTISRPAAVKTGTSEDYRDAWTIGYTPSLVVGVWVGNNDNKPMSQVAGSLGAAPIWRNIMEKVLQGQPKEEFIKPVGVTELTVCAFNGLPLRNQTATSSATKEYFIKGTEPRKFCTVPKPTATPSSTPNPEGQPAPPPSEDSAVIQARIEEQLKQAEKEMEKRQKEIEKELKKNEAFNLFVQPRSLAAFQTVLYS